MLTAKDWSLGEWKRAEFGPTAAAGLEWAEASVARSASFGCHGCGAPGHPDTPTCKSPAQRRIPGNRTRNKARVSEPRCAPYVSSAVGPTGRVGSPGDPRDRRRAAGSTQSEGPPGDSQRPLRTERMETSPAGGTWPQDVQAENVLILFGNSVPRLAACTIWKFFLTSNRNPSFCDVSRFLPFPPRSCVLAKKES